MVSRWSLALAAAGVGSLSACQAFLFAEEERAGGAVSDASAGGDATTHVGDGAPDSIASDYAAAVLSDEPFAYWTFDGPAPEEDRVSRRRAIARGNPSVTFDVVGARGRGVKFPGTGGYLQVDDTDGSFDLLHSQSFSIEVWIRPDALTGPYNDFLERRVTPALPEFYNGFVWGMDSNALVGFYMWFPPGNPDGGTEPNGAMEFIQSGASVNQKFIHLVLTHTAGGDYGLFVDGGDSRGQFSPARTAGDAGPRPMPTQPTWIGARFNGVIDELALYRRALGIDRIKAHHSLGRR